jgi:RNA polymerase sigma factor (sigma-70 family)
MQHSAKDWTVRELLDSCVKGDETGWQEFVRRYHSAIRSSVITTFRRKTREADHWLQDPDVVVEDLIQTVYVRLIEDQGRALHHFEAQDERQIFQYLSMIAINVVRDYFREMNAFKRPKISFSLDELLNDSDEPSDEASGHEREPAAGPSTDLTIGEIEQALNNVVTGKNKDRDKLIFRLRYVEGLSIEEIVQALDLDLSAIAVGSLLGRMVQRIRASFASQPRGGRAGMETTSRAQQLDRPDNRRPWHEQFISQVNTNDVDSARQIWNTAANAATGADADEWQKSAVEALLKVASQSGYLGLVRQLIAESSLEGRLFPLARAIDYLLTGDEALIEKLSPEIRGIVEEIVAKLRSTANQSKPEETKTDLTGEQSTMKANKGKRKLAPRRRARRQLR